MICIDLRYLPYGCRQYLVVCEGRKSGVVSDEEADEHPGRADVVNDGQHEHGDVEDASVVIHTGQNAEQPTQGFVLYLLLTRFTRKQFSTH